MTKMIMGLGAVALLAGTVWAGALQPPPSVAITEEGVAPAGRYAQATEAASGLDPTVAAPTGLRGDIYVVPGDSIQAAITAANPGDVIHVAAGLYAENIVVNKSITIDGAPAGLTTIVPAVSGPGGDAGPSFSDSQVFVIQAHDVTISNLTVDGDNASLTSGVVRNGADIDARNGIIEADGPWNNLVVHHCTVKNIYLRGIYARSGGSGFHFHDNAVQNVAGGAASIAIFNFGGSGIIEDNTVTLANDAIAANWSRGTQFLNNIVTQSGSGVHTDNNGGWGGVADLLQGNQVSNALANGYGVWVFFPYFNTQVTGNTVTNVDVGLFAWGGAGGVASFTNNSVDGTGRPGSIGIYVTCGPDYWGSYQSNVSASFTTNSVSNTAYGFYVEADETAPFFSTTVAVSGQTFGGTTSEVALFGLGTFNVSGLSGATVSVFNPGSIQLAVDLASPAGTVYVDAGTYNESVTMNKSLNLVGAGCTETVWRGTTITGRSLRINRNTATPANIHVEVSGFSFETENNQTILADWSSSYAEALTLDIHDNCFAHVNSRNPGNDFALWVDSANQAARGTLGAIRVHRNTLDTVTGGLLFENCRAVDAVENTIKTTYEGITFNYYSTGVTCGEQLVEGNVFTHQVVDWAFAMNNWHGDGSYAILPSIVTHNEIGPDFYYAILYGVDASQTSAHDFSIVDNALLSGRITVWGDYASQVVLNASGNWWGDAASPAGRATAGRVDYTPWLGVGTDTGDPGFQGDFSALWVDDDSPQTGTVGRIQEGVDLVNGSTVNVLPGLYAERVVVATALTLLGATHGVPKDGYAVPANYAWDTAVESVISNPAPAPTGDISVVDLAADDVVFKGFVVQSLNAPPASANDHLLRINAQSAARDNILIENNIIGPNTHLTSQTGTNGRMGLYFASPYYPTGGSGVTNTIVRHNKIFDCRGNGDNVFIWGSAASYASPGPADYSGTVLEYNEIYGSHRTGIEIAGGVADLTIQHNTIRGNSSQVNGAPYDANLKWGNGIAVIRMGSDKTNCAAPPAEGLTIANNTIRDNEKNGVYFGPANTGHALTDNVISGNGQDGVRVDLAELYYGGTATPCNGVAYDIALRANQILGNATGASVLGTPENGFILDAAENNWGSGEGPADAIGTYEVSAGDCGPSAAVMVNADPVAALGNAVTENVDYCPWTMEAKIALRPQGGDACFKPGDTLIVEVYLGDVSTPENIVGGDFFLAYDMSKLDFVSADVGDSPFATEVHEVVNESTGEIDYGVGVTLGGPGTKADTVMARLSFAVLSGTNDCAVADLVTFRLTHDPPTKLSDHDGNPVYPGLYELQALALDSAPPVLADCDDVTVAPAFGTTEREVTLAVAATDNCAGAVPVTYERWTGTAWAALPNPYTFPSGTTLVKATAVDDCGNSDSCEFEVTVNSFYEVEVVVEIDSLTDADVTRCITFEVWDCDTTSKVIVPAEVDFVRMPVGEPYTYSAGTVTLPVAAGKDYDCITARDKLHSLRRTGTLTKVGDGYAAAFVGTSPSGARLISGNFNDDKWIDILDFGVFSAQWDTHPSASTDCATAYPHADATGDGWIWSGDFTAVQINYLKGRDTNCCGAPGFREGDDGDGPITEISVAELRQLGLGHLAAGDLNRDGWLDEADVAAFLQGVRPKPVRTATPEAIEVQGLQEVDHQPTAAETD